MKAKKLSLFFLLGILFLFAVSGFSQSKFSNPNVEYTFELPEDDWKMTVKPSEYSPNVEYVYKYKKDGHLKIRKMKIKEDTLYSEIIREEEQKLQFVPGYVAGKEENFSGAAFNGRIFNYEYVRSGRPMSGRFYFLKANPTTIFVLRFTGLKDSLRSLLNQTDWIARSFDVKKGK